MFDPLVRIRADLADVATEARAGWPGPVQSERVVELVHIADRARAELLRAVGQWDAEGLWAEDGAVSATSWLAANSTVSRAEAARMVRAARLLREHEATAAALASGVVSCTQVDVLATITRNREDLYPEGEHALLTVAKTLNADDFVAVARKWRSMADDAMSNEDAFAIHERRYLHASKTLFGTVRIDGELDLDGGEMFLSALAAADEPGADCEEGGRTGAQRNADNLVQIASVYVGAVDADARPQFSAGVVIDLDILIGDRRSLRHSRRELEHLGPIAQETALRLACDASVVRVIMAGRSELLDLGRSTRVVSRAQRRALVLRDGGCAFPGCDRAPGWCDAHHIAHWVSGGPTDLRNLVLLCRRHHVLCHEGGWHLARGPDGSLQVYRPDGSELVLAA